MRNGRQDRVFMSHRHVRKQTESSVADALDAGADHGP